MKPSLRAASSEDSPRIAQLLTSTRAEFMPYAPSAHSDDDVRLWVASVLVPGGGVIVAEVDGQVVGVTATARSGDHSWINQMAVEPRLVGNMIGSTLLAWAMKELPRPIRLYTFQANVGARRFYERHGFAAVEFTDGQDNEELCPDVLYELATPQTEA